MKDTPRSNFKATIEVPKAADLVHLVLSAGELLMSAITGNKDIESTAGNIEIAVGDPGEYSSVDASLKAGDINAGVFASGSKSGLFPHFTWSGKGNRYYPRQARRRQPDLAGQVEAKPATRVLVRIVAGSLTAFSPSECSHAAARIPPCAV